MQTFKEIIGKQIDRLFISVWPPFGESSLLDVDISIGFTFSDKLNELHFISTQNEDRWTPIICKENIPNFIIPWTSFNKRIKKWMNSIQLNDFTIEYYELTNVELFNNIVNNKILSIEYLKVKNIDNPFGVKLIFNNDYILFTSTADGNTIETINFNKNNNINNFKELGQIEYDLVSPDGPPLPLVSD